MSWRTDQRRRFSTRQCETCGRFYRHRPRSGEHPEGLDPDLCPAHRPVLINDTTAADLAESQGAEHE